MENTTNNISVYEKRILFMETKGWLFSLQVFFFSLAEFTENLTASYFHPLASTLPPAIAKVSQVESPGPGALVPGDPDRHERALPGSQVSEYIHTPRVMDGSLTCECRH